MKPNRIIPSSFFLMAFFAMSVLITGCDKVDLFEKRTILPKHEWQKSNKLSFTFNITDTNSLYQLFYVMRHTEAYSFNNIYLDVAAKGPVSDSASHEVIDIRLGTDENGWLAEGMGDVYDHRHPISGEFLITKPGEYTYTLQQIMREDPLQNVIDVGIRLEKVRERN